MMHACTAKACANATVSFIYSKAVQEHSYLKSWLGPQQNLLYGWLEFPAALPNATLAFTCQKHQGTFFCFHSWRQAFPFCTRLSINSFILRLSKNHSYSDTKRGFSCSSVKQQPVYCKPFIIQLFADSLCVSFIFDSIYFKRFHFPPLSPCLHCPLPLPFRPPREPQSALPDPLPL